MSIDQPGVIDFVTQEKDGTVVLVVSDHLDWQDREGHLLALRSKLRTYLEFIVSGDLRIRFPETEGRRVDVSVKLHYQPDPAAQPFFSAARGEFMKAGIQLKFELFSGTPYPA